MARCYTTPVQRTPLSSRSQTKSHPNRLTRHKRSSQVLTAANRALSYASARRNNCITYYACDMHLFLHLDASYLSRSHARSVVGGYFFLGNEKQPLNINGATHVFSSIIPCIVSSAGEAEYAALFAGAQQAASLRTILSDLGYSQAPTIIMCDNTCVLASLPIL